MPNFVRPSMVPGHAAFDVSTPHAPNSNSSSSNSGDAHTSQTKMRKEDGSENIYVWDGEEKQKSAEEGEAPTKARIVNIRGDLTWYPSLTLREVHEAQELWRKVNAFVTMRNEEKKSADDRRVQSTPSTSSVIAGVDSGILWEGAKFEDPISLQEAVVLGCTAVNQASAMRAVAQLGRDLEGYHRDGSHACALRSRRGDGSDGAKEPEDLLTPDDIAFLSIRTCLHPNDRNFLKEEKVVQFKAVMEKGETMIQNGIPLMDLHSPVILHNSSERTLRSSFDDIIYNGALGGSFTQATFPAFIYHQFNVLSQEEDGRLVVRSILVELGLSHSGYIGSHDFSRFLDTSHVSSSPRNRGGAGLDSQGSMDYQGSNYSITTQEAVEHAAALANEVESDGLVTRSNFRERYMKAARCLRDIRSWIRRIPPSNPLLRRAVANTVFLSHYQRPRELMLPQLACLMQVSRYEGITNATLDAPNTENISLVGIPPPVVWNNPNFQLQLAQHMNPPVPLFGLIGAWIGDTRAGTINPFVGGVGSFPNAQEIDGAHNTAQEMYVDTNHEMIDTAQIVRVVTTTLARAVNSAKLTEAQERKLQSLTNTTVNTNMSVSVPLTVHLTEEDAFPDEVTLTHWPQDTNLEMLTGIQKFQHFSLMPQHHRFIVTLLGLDRFSRHDNGTSVAPQNPNMMKFLRVHYLDFNRKYDEVIPMSAARLQPLRSHSRTLATIASSAVQDILVENSTERVQRWRESSACIEIKIRCLWLAGNPGCGLIRMKCPDYVTAQEILREYCKCMSVNQARAGLAIIDMGPAMHYALARRRRGDIAMAMMQNERCSETPSPYTDAVREKEGMGLVTDKLPLHRLSSPGVTYMHLHLPLKDYGISDGAILDVIYNPSKDEVWGRRRSKSLARQLPTKAEKNL